MLVLTRKSQERILIGDEIAITVVKIHGSAVRIGIEAPKNVRVVRGEIACKVSANAEVDAVSDSAEKPYPPVDTQIDGHASKRPAAAGNCSPWSARQLRPGEPPNRPARTQSPCIRPASEGH